MFGFKWISSWKCSLFLYNKKSSAEAFHCLFSRFFTGEVFIRGMWSFYSGIKAAFYDSASIVGGSTFLLKLEKKMFLKCGSKKFDSFVNGLFYE